MKNKADNKNLDNKERLLAIARADWYSFKLVGSQSESTIRATLKQNGYYLRH